MADLNADQTQIQDDDQVVDDDVATGQSGATQLTVPADVEEQYPELIALIKKSKSMNDEERQYWVDVLPVMSEDQVKNLRGILDNEKKQLAEAAEAYAKQVADEEGQVASAFDEVAYIEKKRIREEAEAEHEAEEKMMEEDVLSELENL